MSALRLAVAGLVVTSVTACGADDARSPGTPPPSTGPASTSPAAVVPGAPEAAPALRRARTPAELADQLVSAERTIADEAAAPADVAAAGRLQQLAYRVLGNRPEWDADVRRLVPPWVTRVAGPNVESRREFRSMHGRTLSRTLPAWRIVEPVPAGALKEHYLEAERQFGVDWEFLAAINLVETGMGRIRGLSSAGAQGPMQFIPSTWAAYGRGDIDDPRDAILAAGRYLRAMGFRSGGSAAVDRALFRYNNHTAYVRGVRLLAEVMQRRPRAYLGYHAWEVYYLTERGDVLLPVGYAEREPVGVGAYLRRAGGG